MNMSEKFGATARLLEQCYSGDPVIAMKAIRELLELWPGGRIGPGFGIGTPPKGTRMEGNYLVIDKEPKMLFVRIARLPGTGTIDIEVPENSTVGEAIKKAGFKDDIKFEARMNGHSVNYDEKVLDRATILIIRSAGCRRHKPTEDSIVPDPTKVCQRRKTNVIAIPYSPDVPLDSERLKAIRPPVGRERFGSELIKSNTFKPKNNKLGVWVVIALLALFALSSLGTLKGCETFNEVYKNYKEAAPQDQSVPEDEF